MSLEMKKCPDQGFEITNLPAGANTTQIKASAGFIHALGWALGAPGKADLYDHASANSNKAARIDCGTASGQHIYNMKMDLGIRVVTDANWVGGYVCWL